MNLHLGVKENGEWIKPETSMNPVIINVIAYFVNYNFITNHSVEGFP